MTALGLPDDMRAAARSGASSNAGARITFADVFSFLYVAQSEINRDIAHSQDSYREPKRKAVFELLFGLTNAGILTMRSDLNALNAEIDCRRGRAPKRSRRSCATAIPPAARKPNRHMSAAAAAQPPPKPSRPSLREAINPVTDRETLRCGTCLPKPSGPRRRPCHCHRPGP